ncbi:MAG: hypothetical protein HYS32_03835 [Candidatus Woesearchaeota archaeon]|nr:MAG: hypothetical protein HYS32_03835 [Candidatus Woesearchaeota archaeon]
MKIGVTEKFKENIKDLEEYIALVTVDSEYYQDTNLNLVKHLVEEQNIPGVYVTLNKPYKTVEKLFTKNGIDLRLIIFIDAVTRTAGSKVEKTDKCLFIGSPEKMSDISIAMDQAVKSLPGKDKFVFFDSLSTLLLYNNPITVARFIHFLTNKIRMWGVKGVVISLQKEKDKDLIDELSQFCDFVLDVGGD